MGRATTSVEHNESTIYILILNEILFFRKSMDHLLINKNQIRSFGVTVSDDAFDRTQEFLINHKELFIPFNTEGTSVLFDTYVPSNHKL